MKLVVEDLELRQRMVDYLALNGTEVDEDTPVSITLPGSGQIPQRCESGSGKMTMGGRFTPGYDAKLKSALYAIYRGEPDKVPAELQEHGPMYIPVDQWTREQAVAAMEKYGWPLPVIKEKKEKKPKPEKEVGEDGEPITRKGRKRAKKENAEAETESQENGTGEATQEVDMDKVMEDQQV